MKIDKQTMSEFCTLVTVVNQRGLHARAAAKFVRIVEKFGAEIIVARGEMSVSGRSIMGLMMLAAGRGTQLKICACGHDAEAAIDALTNLVAGKFDED